ncbi:hypothetical protein ANTRET_LOCUS9717 [Anthophora retusa]
MRWGPFRGSFKLRYILSRNGSRTISAIIILVTPLLPLMSHTDIERHNIETCSCTNMYACFQVKVDDYG